MSPASAAKQRETANLLAVAVRLIEDLPTLSVRQIAREVRINEQSIYRAWKERHPGRFARRSHELGVHTSPDFRLACETMLGVFEVAAGRRCVQEDRDSPAQMTAGEALSATEAEYGRLGRSPAARERRLYRIITALLAAGKIEASGPRGRQLYKLVGAK